jgi:hypothetical protein
MKYFLHDTNAFNDEKVTELFIQYGYEGVGLFYTILERIAAQEKPIKTAVLKTQLNVGKRLEKCWQFMEEIGIISSSNGETFNERILSYSEKYQIKKEKTRERVEQFRAKQAEPQADTEIVTHYTDVTKRDCNADKVKESKVKEINISFSEFWNAYGKKEGKSPCEKKWKLLSNEDRQNIMAILPSYIARTPNIVYRKNPSTFLNQRVWEDEAYTEPAAVQMKVLKAVGINEMDFIVYEDGSIRPPGSWNDLEDIKAGRKNLSILDRKAS